MNETEAQDAPETPQTPQETPPTFCGVPVVFVDKLEGTQDLHYTIFQYLPFASIDCPEGNDDNRVERLGGNERLDFGDS